MKSGRKAEAASPISARRSHPEVFALDAADSEPPTTPLAKRLSLVGLGDAGHSTRRHSLSLPEPLPLPTNGPASSSAGQRSHTHKRSKLPDLRQFSGDARTCNLQWHKAGTFAHAAPTGGNADATCLDAECRRSLWQSGSVRMLMRRRTPHQRYQTGFVWQRCWADVRAHHLILRRCNGSKRSQECAIPLPGSEVLPLSSLLASDFGHWVANSSPSCSGFEVRPVGSHASVVICLQASQGAEQWLEVLCRESRRPGVGHLLLGTPDGSSWSLQWCIFDFQAKRLDCYLDPIDYALGHSSRCALDVGGAAVRPFADLDGEEGELNETELVLKESWPFGFEVEEFQTDETWTSASRRTVFGASSPGDLERWLGVLQAAPRALRWKSRPPCFVRRPSFGHDRIAAEPPGWGPETTDDAAAFDLWARMRPSFGLAFDRVPGLTKSQNEGDDTQAMQPPPTQEMSAHEIDGSLRQTSPVVPPLSTKSAAYSKGWPCCSNAEGLKSRCFPRESDDCAQCSESELSEPVDTDSSSSQGDAEPCRDECQSIATSLGQLLQLAAALHQEERQLRRELRAAEQAARSSLAFFGKEVEPRMALELLATSLKQLSALVSELQQASDGASVQHQKRKAELAEELRKARTKDMLVASGSDEDQEMTAAVDSKLSDPGDHDALQD